MRTDLLRLVSLSRWHNSRREHNMRRSTVKRRTVMAAAAGAFAASALPLSRAAADDTRSQLASMTLDQKIGQVLWTHVFGASADDASMARKNQLAFGDDVRTPAQAVQKYHLGGVLYFNWSGNISTPTNPAAVAHLSNGLQEAARTSSTAPLAIAVDQEGGIVARITSPATEFPGNMALGAVNDPRAARAQGAVLGRELAALGINVDFAPDVDVNTNPANPVIGVRSMGDDPVRVGVLGVEQIRGIQSRGVAATAKHFPGHGDTQIDSHLGLPVVEYGRTTLKRHLVPFRMAISAEVDMIMTAHIIVKTLDPTMPATLSKKVLTGLLREQMGYRGIITTDALDMEGAQLAVMTEDEKGTYTRLKAAADAEGNDPTAADEGHASAEFNAFMKPIRGRVAVQAFEAGSDILLNPHDADAVVTAMRRAIADGRVSERRLDESVLRILSWKRRRCITGRPVDLTAADREVRSGRKVADDIAARSVTMLVNDGTLPLKPSRVLVTGTRRGNPEYLVEPLRLAGFTPILVPSTGQEPTTADVEKAVTVGVDAVIVVTHGLKRGDAQDAMVKALARTGNPVVEIMTGTPYDVAMTHRPHAALAVYSNRKVSMVAAVAMMAGRNPVGRLPVRVPDPNGGTAFPRGFGLSYRATPGPYEGPGAKTA